MISDQLILDKKVSKTSSSILPLNRRNGSSSIYRFSRLCN